MSNLDACIYIWGRIIDDGGGQTLQPGNIRAGAGISRPILG